MTFKLSALHLEHSLQWAMEYNLSFAKCRNSDLKFQAKKEKKLISCLSLIRWEPDCAIALQNSCWRTWNQTSTRPSCSYRPWNNNRARPSTRSSTRSSQWSTSMRPSCSNKAWNNDRARPSARSSTRPIVNGPPPWDHHAATGQPDQVQCLVPGLVYDPPPWDHLAATSHGRTTEQDQGQGLVPGLVSDPPTRG